MSLYIINSINQNRRAANELSTLNINAPDCNHEGSTDIILEDIILY